MSRGLDDAHYKHLYALIAQAMGQGSPFQVASVFVLRPGGVPYRNVFVTWASLMAAASQTQGPIAILFDGSLGAIHITAGASPWNVDHYTFISASDYFTPTPVIFDKGASFVWTDEFSIVGSLVFQRSADSITPAALVAGNQLIRMGLNSELQALGAQPWLECANGAFAAIVLGAGTLGDGTHNAIKIDAGASLVIAASNLDGGSSTVAAHALVGGAGATVTISRGFGAAISAQADYTGTLTLIFEQNAASAAYTPGDPTKWVGPAPTTVQQALDRIAANTTNAHPIP